MHSAMVWLAMLGAAIIIGGAIYLERRDPKREEIQFRSANENTPHSDRRPDTSSVHEKDANTG